MKLTNQIKSLNDQVKSFSAEKIIKFSYEKFGNRMNFASSLGVEDQILTDMIATIAPQMEVFTLDTGRLFPETYELLAKTQKRYSLNYKVYYPDTKTVQDMVNQKGINLFYESVENRKLCCHIRKVEPLQRALAHVDAWISGIRRGQSLTRSAMEVFEADQVNNKIKISPLAYWSLDDVNQYIKKHTIDINPLYKENFISIGCAPCTRAIKPGEDIRAGRWWWENTEQKECGLHRKKKT